MTTARSSPARKSRREQVIHRLAGCWRHWGERHGYFDTSEDAQAFYDELSYMLLHQMAAPNSPQWFNTGLNWAYGITGPARGTTTWTPRPARHARAKMPTPIRSRTLVSFSPSTTIWSTPAGSWTCGFARRGSSSMAQGTGTNFSKLRGENEPLVGGGKSSGLMSFLKIGDRAAGAIKSGGTTRRAAKMVCLDLDHPDIEAFINWKVREELKVAAMVEGLKHLPREQRDTAEQDRPETGLRLQRRSVPDRLGSELQQLGAHPDELFQGVG